MRPRFLLDEHVNRAVQRQLRRWSTEIEALAIGDTGAPARGTSDPEILIWLEERGFLLVTEDRSTVPVHLSQHLEAGRYVPGALWIRPQAGIGTIIEELYLIWSVATAEEFVDQALFIPL